jgi:uncharacterized protein (TIGR02594 family)
LTHHIVLATSLNVRAHPRTTSDSLIMAVLPAGTAVEELDANADRSWLRIRLGAIEGWASNRYLCRKEAYMNSSWLSVAASEFGIAEIAGPEHNPRIQTYLSTVVAKDARDETSWCSAFAKWCVLQARHGNPKIPDPKKISAAARSWHLQKWGSDVSTTAPLGSIVVLWRRRKATEPGFTEADRSGTPEQVQAKGSGGHVGFLASPYRPGDTQISLLGGNQSNRVCKSTYQLGHDYGLLSIRGY